MKIRKLSECKTYQAPKHVACASMRLQGKDESGLTKFWCGMSYFLPGGGAEWAYEDNPLEKVYIVLDGELTIKTKDEERVLGPMDSVFLAPNEGREIWNKTNKMVTMLVIVNYP
jgi:glyoxylate utilization-related uncharacterized protein